MPDIKAFRAWRYDVHRVKNTAQLVAPPYDVISKEEQEKLYNASPYNVIRLEYGKQDPGDNESQNVYTRAKGFMDSWKKEGVLTRERVPALYVYVQDYIEEGKAKTRLGFYAAMKLDEKAVLKHENTLTGPKEDRLKLLKEVRTNLSPIFGLFEDKKGGVQKELKKALKQPVLMDVTVAGVRHRLFVEKRQEVIAPIVKGLKGKPMFIADGHHRFEVACQFKKWMKEGAKSDGAWEYVLTYFSDCLHNPFKIFPTHRLVKVPDRRDALRELRNLGELRPAKDLDEVLAKLDKCRAETKDKKYVFGFFSAKDGFWLLTLSPKIASSVKKNPVETLDVAVLHKKIVEPCFDIRAVEKSPDIDFTRDAQEAVKKVRAGQFDMAIFLRPTSLPEMLLVSKKGLKMPQKSTYFYPKLLTGLVFHGFEPENGNG